MGIPVAAIEAGYVALFLIDHALQHKIGKPHDKCTKPCIFLEQRHHVVVDAGIPVGIFVALK